MTDGSWAGGAFGERGQCVLAPNPNIMTLDGTNSWVLREPGARRSFVVDPGPLDDAHLDAVAEAVRRSGTPARLQLKIDTGLSRNGCPPEEWAGLVERARAADLVAVMELATRRGDNPVADLAHRQLVAMVRRRDLHAVAEAAP